MSPADDTSPRRNASSSLRRALGILMYLAEERSHPHGPTLTDLATGLELSKSTVLRLVAPLKDVRLVDQDPESGRYRLGPQNALLGQAYLERRDTRQITAPALHRLAEESGETVHLVSFDPPEIVYIDKVESPRAVRMHSRIGGRLPAYCTATGKVFLAHSGDDVVDGVIAAGLPARTPATITSPDRLRAELDLIRRRGYAVDDVENEQDIRCVAAPVHDHTGAVTTAVSISGPAARVTRERLPELGTLLMSATRTLTADLGGTATTTAQD
ncbi:DNA-binding IclR family transcriptional regulator [Streptomyces sp. SAI-126]|jgi:DNA-binding IclR family transcriptional regulator|uniref:IclR family transcriptional regulator n=1 Tax=unclassified Streptomyces TaxID=2593676 RepID=UPI000F4EF90D|nr:MULTISPECIES: IclR family transcriptional regulator [unclassified Streptomyces]QUC59885.1 IclR family transcriptional regulator [Streptomyces sp. A2-16]GLP64745.1 IclR family transcriptional regulator [Streptomyces sp. TUS-ST3]